MSEAKKGKIPSVIAVDMGVPAVVAVDTGGTFTDVLLLDGGRLHSLKVPSTPSDPAEAVLGGLRQVLNDVEREDDDSKAEGTKADAAFVLLHGSTVATNALLERKGARVMLVTNAGFEDILEIGRQNRPPAIRPRRPPSTTTCGP